jgi:UDP-N-acetyl-2-amino-2-deoxyglucuronate dehydrogenase
MPDLPGPIVDRKIRFALVGCGRIAGKHVEAIQRHATNAELVGVCDSDPAALRKAEATAGVPGFGSLAELLRGPATDAIILATPSGLHAGQTIEAAGQGATS